MPTQRRPRSLVPMLLMSVVLPALAGRAYAAEPARRQPPPAPAAAPQSPPAESPPAATPGTPALATPASTGIAQSGTEGVTEEQAQARRLFERGALFFSERRNAEAAYLFEQAAALRPDPRFSYNLGLVYADMGDISRSLAAFRGYLRGAPEGAERVEAEARILELHKRLNDLGLQQVSVTSSPSLAIVTVDDKPLGLTPLNAELPLGKHRVVVTQAGYAPAEVEVELTRGPAIEVGTTLQATPSKPPELEEPELSPFALTLLGVGAGALIGGTVFEVSRSSALDRAGATDSANDAAEYRGEARAHRMASLTLFGFGGGFVVAGAVLLVRDLWGQPNAAKTRQANAWCHTQGCGIDATLHF